MVFSDDFLHFLKIKKKIIEITNLLSCGSNSSYNSINFCIHFVINIYKNINCNFRHVLKLSIGFKAFPEPRIIQREILLISSGFSNMYTCRI